MTINKIKFICIALLSLTIISCGNKKSETTKKDTLVFAQLTDPKTLDPQNSTDTYSQNAIAQIYDRLFEIDETNGTPIPSLLKEYKRVDDNTILLTLKDNIKFSNGEPLTTEDVKFTLERAKKNPKVVHLYKTIENINIIDDQNLELITAESFAPLLNHLSHKTSSILNKKAVEELGDKYFENPIGTGAYKVKSWSVGDNITLEAVDNYFNGEPAIKYVIIKSVPEENSRVIGLETGEIDMALDVPTISWDSLEETGKVNMVVGSSPTTGYVGINTKSHILSDPEVRQAIATAIDKQAIVDTVYMGKVKVANQFLAPPVFGHNTSANKQEFNIEKAKNIIQNKGLENKNLKIVVSSPERVQMATIIQDQLKKIGLNLNIELLEWGTFLAETGAGKSDLFIMGWAPSTYDGDYGYYPNIHSSQVGSNGNRAYYSNEKVDTLLENARKELDSTKRKAFYDEITEIIAIDVPVIPLYHGNTVYGVNKDLKNVNPSGYPEFYKYKFTEK